MRKYSSLQHIAFYAGPVLIYAMLIFYLSSLSRLPEEVPSFYGFDKLAHFLEYYVFGWLIYRWLGHAKRPFLQAHAFLLTIFIGIGYGLSDEWHQSFVQGRDSTLWDALFDAIGVAAAAFTFRFARGRITHFPGRWKNAWNEWRRS